MTLEDLNKIDIIATSKDGKKITLAIADAGTITDPMKRFEMLIEKVRLYASYTKSDQFKNKFPGIEPKDVIITVLCKTKPTKDMENLAQISVDKENTIPVEFIYKKTQDKTGRVKNILNRTFRK